MNRLILVGNGFDLAHGLKTGYRDFIEHLWCTIYEELKNKARQEGTLYNNPNKLYRFVDSNKILNICYTDPVANSLNRTASIRSKGKTLTFPPFEIEDQGQVIREFIENVKMIDCKHNNVFFKIITNNYLDKNWSDIEADYYKELKLHKDSEEKVNILNNGFKQIKELLRKYLLSLEKPKKIKELEDEVYFPIDIDDTKISFKDLLQSELLDRLQKIKSSEYERIKEKILNRSRRFSSGKLDSIKDIVYAIINIEDVRKGFLNFFLPDNILLLNFNYTSVDSVYIKKPVYSPLLSNDIDAGTIYIHGSLDDPTKHMIFGYGDEEDDNYKELEKSETKGLLDNVKSINYLEASNYRNMEKFIESGYYQIVIMGMSCGMADRTMLRKLFQHKNCISIKPYFHQWKNEKEEIQDNYTEIVQNIFRCFSDKDLLRSIVTDKSKCKPLPQQTQ